MSGARGRRVDEAIREVVAEVVQRELSDPRLGFVTITAARANNDLTAATVWFSTLDPDERDASAAALASASGLLQSRVGAALRTKNTPQLSFEYDELQGRAEALTRLIDEVAPDDVPEEPTGDAPGLAEAGDAEPVLAALADPAVRWAVASHRNPDGDALGSLLGAARALRSAGRDVVLVHPDGGRLPEDLAFMLREDEIIGGELPEDVGERTLLAVDCASEARLWDGDPPWGAGRVINVDHHHDNTAFGDLNVVLGDASSAAEVVHDLLVAAELPIDADVAEALYVGLITDTGNFTYSNAGPRSHEVAAALIRKGIDHAGIARKLYEEQPLGRIRLLGRALERARVMMDGGLMVSHLERADFRELDATDTETVVEVMRSVEGVESAALARELEDGAWRVSLRTSRDDVDVSVIAREEGGGGHRAAAGFTTTRPPDDLFDWIAGELARQA